MLCVGVSRAVVEVEWGMGMVFGGGFTVDSLRLYVGGVVARTKLRITGIQIRMQMINIALR